MVVKSEKHFIVIKMELNFNIEGKPIGKSRPRFTKFGRAYTPKQTKDYELYIKTIAQTAMKRGNLTITANKVRVLLKMIYPIPVSWSKTAKQAAREGKVTPKVNDIDNVAKAVLDALNDVVYKDDRQVYFLQAEKTYETPDDKPKITVYICWE